MQLPGGLAGTSQERDSKVFCTAQGTTVLDKGLTARVLGERKTSNCFSYSFNPKPEAGKVVYSENLLAYSYALDKTHKELVSSKMKEIFKCGSCYSQIRDAQHELCTFKYQVIAY